MVCKRRSMASTVRPKSHSSHWFHKRKRKPPLFRFQKAVTNGQKGHFINEQTLLKASYRESHSIKILFFRLNEPKLVCRMWDSLKRRTTRVNDKTLRRNPLFSASKYRQCYAEELGVECSGRKAYSEDCMQLRYESRQQKVVQSSAPSSLLLEWM